MDTMESFNNKKNKITVKDKILYTLKKNGETPIPVLKDKVDSSYRYTKKQCEKLIKDGKVEMVDEEQMLVKYVKGKVVDVEEESKKTSKASTVEEIKQVKESMPDTYTIVVKPTEDKYDVNYPTWFGQLHTPLPNVKKEKIEKIRNWTDCQGNKMYKVKIIR